MPVRYTKEAEQYIKDNWGVEHPKTIVKNLEKLYGEHRTVERITVKARLLGLGTLAEAYNIITIADVARALNVRSSYLTYINIPRRKFQGDKRTCHVDIKKFWEWAYKNQDKFDFSKYQKGSLLPEPKWLEKAIKEKTKKNNVHRWTEEEEAALKIYKSNGKSNKDIAKKIGVTPDQVTAKLCQLKRDKATPLTKKKELYTPEEKKKIIELRNNGLKYEEIGKIVNKQAASVYRVYKKYTQGDKQDG